MRKTMPIALRVLGESNDLTLKTRWNYAKALYKDSDATLDERREAVRTLEETERTARRVFGDAHPLVRRIGDDLRVSRGMLCAARDTPSANA